MKALFHSNHPFPAALRILVPYCLLAAVWSGAADPLLGQPLASPTPFIRGPFDSHWMFAAVSALLLFGLLSVEIRRHRREEAALRASEERHRSLISLAVDGILLGDNDGSITEANDQILLMFGMERSDLLGRHITDLPFTRESVEAVPFRFDLLRQGRVVVSERDLVRPDGSEITVEMRTKMMPDGTYQSIYRDITLHKRKEADLERLRIAIEQAAEVIVITDGQGAIQYANPAFERVTGYAAQEALGQNPRILKSGRQDDAFYAEMWQTISAGRPWTGRLVNRSREGDYFTEEATISPVFDSRGVIVNYVAVKKDITRQLELEAQLIRAQKMEAIGTLAGGIAHDFNNILSAIIGYAQMAQDATPPDSVAARDLAQVLEAGERATGLVRRILAFSRRQDGNRLALEPGGLVREVVRLLRPTLPATIAINCSIAEPVHAVHADPAQLHQILMNLCTNAYHAMELAGGVLHIEVRDRLLTEADLSPQSPLCAGRYVEFSVADTGCGIPPEIQDRIFDPYFTTKEVGKGTGLGLAIVHSVVTSHQGLVRCVSDEGVGTTFRVLLPALVRESGEVSRPAGVMGGRERILFVDDEELLANLGKTMLERLGYAVVACCRSCEALEIFLREPGRFDLVITDQTMPDLTGIELARQLLARRPELPVILATGHSTLVSEESALAEGLRGFVYKPLTKGTLARLVREILDQPSPVQPKGESVAA